ncbi:MAG: hypothetical protein ACI8WY_003295, partial [Planctomycetota bacterium]
MEGFGIGLFGLHAVAFFGAEWRSRAKDLSWNSSQDGLGPKSAAGWVDRKRPSRFHAGLRPS